MNNVTKSTKSKKKFMISTLEKFDDKDFLKLYEIETLVLPHDLQISFVSNSVSSKLPLQIFSYRELFTGNVLKNPIKFPVSVSRCGIIKELSDV